MLNKRLCFCYAQWRLALIVRILQQECILCMERIRWLSALISKQEETIKAAQSNFWPLDSKNTQRNKTLIYSQLIRLLWLICKQTIAYSADTQEKLIWHPINAKSLASLKVTLSLISTGLSTPIWSTYSWEKKLKKKKTTRSLNHVTFFFAIVGLSVFKKKTANSFKHNIDENAKNKELKVHKKHSKLLRFLGLAF